MPPSRRHLETWRADTRAERPSICHSPAFFRVAQLGPTQRRRSHSPGLSGALARLPEPQFQRRGNTILHLQVFRPESRASGSTAEALDRIDGINEEACSSRSSTPSPTTHCK